MPNVIEILKQHIPSLTDQAEREIEDAVNADLTSMGFIDYASAAVRYCSCGDRVDGFYAYNDHLVDVIEQAVT